MNKRRRFKAKRARAAFRANRYMSTLGITYSKYATARYLREFYDEARSPDAPPWLRAFVLHAEPPK
jgi:hypothetical protein